MPQETVLVIEDEKNIAELVRFNLEQEGFQVLLAADGTAGIEMAKKSRPSLVILDLMLPGIDGLEVCKILRQNDRTSAMPIIMLTAKAQEADRIVGLELGADDYVTKPFSPRELVARIKAVLRRGREKSKEKMLRCGTIEIDTAKHIVNLKGKPLELTSKEYDLLKALLEADGRVLSRDFLLEHVWGYQATVNIETRTVDMHVGQLRKKLKHEGQRILTVINVGYRFNTELA